MHQGKQWEQVKLSGRLSVSEACARVAGRCRGERPPRRMVTAPQSVVQHLKTLSPCAWRMASQGKP